MVSIIHATAPPDNLSNSVDPDLDSLEVIKLFQISTAHNN